MYQVFNVLTNEPMPVLSETPYELAGPLAERIIEQKRDEQGNLLYLDQEGNETTDAGEASPAVLDDDGNVIVGLTNQHPLHAPVFADAGPLYEWRELIPTPEQIAAETQRTLVNAVQNYLDSAAKQYGYDDIKSAVTYADEPAVPKFQAEGRAFRAWRSLTWATCYAILADVLAGTRPVPTVDGLLAELPIFNLEGEG